jgi:hypothetical protein
MCGRYRLSRRKQLVEEYFDSVSSDEDWSPRYNIAPDPADPGHPPESQGARPRAVAGPLGAHPVMGDRRFFRRQDDQCEVRDRGREARVPRRAEVPQANRLLAPSWARWAKTHCYVHLASGWARLLK